MPGHAVTVAITFYLSHHVITACMHNVGWLLPALRNFLWLMNMKMLQPRRCENARTRPFLKIYFIYHSNNVDSAGKTSVVCSQRWESASAWIINIGPGRCRWVGSFKDPLYGELKISNPKSGGGCWRVLFNTWAHHRKNHRGARESIKPKLSLQRTAGFM